MYQLVELTDGTTTATLTDLVNYALVSYAPTVAPLRDSELGGAGPYVDVMDTLVFHSIGATAANAYAAAGVVNYLLDQARRWWLGKTTTPVTLRVQAQDSTLKPLEVVVLGRPTEDTPNIQLQVGWDATWCKYISEHIAIRFVRRGQFLVPASSDVSASGLGPINNPAKLTATFASSVLNSHPLKAAIDGFDPSTTPTIPASFLIVTDSAAKIGILDAVGMVAFAPATFTSVNDAAKKPYNATNIMRYTPVATTPATAGGLADLSFTNAQTVAVYAAVRNNSLTATWLIHANLTCPAPGGVVSGPDVLIDASIQTPRIVYLGTIACPVATSGLSLTITASTTTGPPTLDISYVAMVNVADDYARVLGLQAMALNVLTNGATSIIADSRLRSLPTPQIRAERSASEYAVMSYRGDSMLQTTNNVCVAMWLACGGFNADRWRFTNSSDVIVQNNITATRHTAYQVPQ